MSVKVIKLISGEEVVAEVSDVDYTLELTNPVALVMQQGAQGMGQTLIPWAHGCKQPVIVKADFVVFQADPSDDLMAAYTQAFSKVQAPRKQLIV
jgi:hypothetical protein